MTGITFSVILNCKNISQYYSIIDQINADQIILSNILKTLTDPNFVKDSYHYKSININVL